MQGGGGCAGSPPLIVKNAVGISCASLSGKRKCSHTSRRVELSGGDESGGGWGVEGMGDGQGEGRGGGRPAGDGELGSLSLQRLSFSPLRETSSLSNF